MVLIKSMIGIRLSEEDEYIGSDVAIHKVAANPKIHHSKTSL